MRIVKIGLAGLVALLIAAIGFLYLTPDTVVRVARDMGRERAGLVLKEINLPNGLHYAYLEGGAGEPLMLLHGFGANKDTFVMAARYLTSRYRVIIPDLVGFAESSHPSGADYSPPAQATRLHDFANALGIKQLHLGGNSMGGHIALTYASSYPSEVASLWLLDPGGIWSAPKSDMFKIIEATGRNPLIVKNAEDFIKMIDLVFCKAPFIPKSIAAVAAQERIDNFQLEEGIIKQIVADSVEQRVTGLKTPALIVWGEQDRVLHLASADILHKLMPQSQVITMPNTGHVPMMEKPKQSVDDYKKFRESIGAVR